MPYRHDPSLYTIVPTRTARESLGLARALVSAASKGATDPVVKRLSVMYSSATALQHAWIEANRPVVINEVRRVADIKLDRAWGASRSRLEDWVDVEDEDHAERAAELLEMLFPTGLDFTNLRYLEQWPESDRRIVLIENDGLADDLVLLIGDAFFNRLITAHAAYGEVLGITSSQVVEAEPPSIVEALNTLRAAISGYGRLLLGLTPDDDDEAIAATEAMLEPMIRYRKVRAATAEAPEPEPDEEPIDAPLPDLPF